MIRAVVIAALVGGVFTFLSETLGLIVFFVVLFGLLAAPGFVTRCPWCRRRVPLGAQVCGRCGRGIRA